MINTATGIEYLSQASHAYVTVNWTASPSTDYVNEYAVEYVDTSAADPTPTTLYTKNNSCKITALNPGHTYQIRVYAKNKVGIFSDPSAPQTVVAAVDTTIPDIPQNLTGTRAPRGANLNWTASSAKDLVGYNIQTSLGGAAYRILVDSNNNPLVVPGNSYYYPAPDGTFPNTGIGFQVRAIDATGNASAWSTAFTINSGGVYFDELVAGQIEAVGTIAGGSFKTAPGSGGQYAIMDANGLRLKDGTSNNYGDPGADPLGTTVDLNSTTGNAFFSGTVAASSITGGTITGATGKNSVGTTLWDTTGLISSQVTSVVGSGSGAGPTLANAGTPQQITQTNTTFTLTRTVTVWVFATTSLGWSLSGANNALLNVGVVGQSSSLTQQCSVLPGGAQATTLYTPCTCSLFITLPAGSYTAALYGCENGTTFASINNWDIHVLQLGS